MTLVLPACGGKAQQEAACVVAVYFDLDATQAQIHSVQARLRADPRVARVTFVSKEQALAIARKKFPELVKNLKSNPLPDAIKATVQEGDAAALVDDLTPAPLGVANVKNGCLRRRTIPLVPLP